MTFYDVLSEKRKAVPTPDNVVDANGNAYFGTFDKEFEHMDFLKVNRPSKLPNAFNKVKLTLWEAIELNLKDIIVLTAVCDMGVFGTGLTLVYDKKSKKVTKFQDMFPKSSAVISKTLLGGDTTESRGKNVVLKCVNHFENGQAFVTGHATKRAELPSAMMLSSTVFRFRALFQSRSVQTVRCIRRRTFSSFRAGWSSTESGMKRTRKAPPSLTTTEVTTPMLPTMTG